jgi:hypothetical protein
MGCNNFQTHDVENTLLNLFIYYDNRAQGTNRYTSRKHKSISTKAQIKAIQTDRTELIKAARSEIVNQIDDVIT